MITEDTGYYRPWVPFRPDAPARSHAGAWCVAWQIDEEEEERQRLEEQRQKEAEEAEEAERARKEAAKQKRLAEDQRRASLFTAARAGELETVSGISETIIDLRFLFFCGIYT